MKSREELNAELAVLEGHQSTSPEPVDQQTAELAAIPDDDPEVRSLLERVEGAEYLKYWPEYKNRNLQEAKEIVFLRRASRDASRSSIERAKTENALMAIRRRLRGDK